MDPLRQFALEVLAILESQEEWNSDTTDDIGSAAMKYKLATADNEDSLFTRTPLGLGQSE